MLLPDSYTVFTCFSAATGLLTSFWTRVFWQFIIRALIISHFPYVFFYNGASDPQWAMASSFTRFIDHTQWRTTISRSSLDEWSARHPEVYLTTHNTHKRQTSMPAAGFEPIIPTSDRPQTKALDRAATGIGCPYIIVSNFMVLIVQPSTQ